MGSIHKLGATAVTVRIAVRNVINLKDIAALMQRLGNGLVGIPGVLALPFTRCIEAVFIDHAHVREVLKLRELEIFFTVSWC